MTEEAFHARLAALGISLDAAAFSIAFKGAQHLRAEVARIETYLGAKASPSTKE